jgi:Ribonuclease G/E
MRILASVSPGEIRLAALFGDALEAYAIWRPGAPDGLGDIHRGRISALVPAMAGAFVALDGAEGFLPESDGAADRTEGALLNVRIVRTAQGGKGVRLRAVDHSGDGPVGLIARGPSPLARLVDAFPSAEIEIDDPVWFAQVKNAYPERVRLVPRAFDDALEADIEALAGANVDLPGGMRASIVPTPALVAIDVDGGSATQARGQKSALQIAANRAALPALARQIRLRNLSGAILIDLAGVPIKRRAVLAPDLAAALLKDPARPRLLGFTQLGLAEILRPRQAAPLHEMLAGPHAAGLAALRDVIRVAGRRVALRAAPGVVAALQTDPVALPDLARRTTYPLMLRSDPSLPPCGWVIEDQT